MCGVHRIGFTQLGGDARDGLYRVKYVFVYSIVSLTDVIQHHPCARPESHPQHTWEDTRDIGRDDIGATTRSKRKTLKAFFTPESRASNSDNEASGEHSTRHRVFWPEDYLTEDIPEARVWTYGYNADAGDRWP